MMNQEEGNKLLKLARDTVSLHFDKKEVEDNYLKKKYNEKQGCFVTINKNNQLRGCIGYPEPVLQLYKAIIQSAISAAFSDPRFPPLQKKELKEIKFEISILTVPELIKVKDPKEYLTKIKIGQDGLIINNQGLLLPQVFTEYSCNPEKALQLTCHKAGMNKDCWKDLNNKVYKFQAQIFSE